MTIARRLQQQGHAVTIFASADNAGGLADAWQVEATRLVGTAQDVVVAEVCRLLGDPTADQQILVTKNPYGQGDVANRVLNLIAERWAK